MLSFTTLSQNQPKKKVNILQKKRNLKHNLSNLLCVVISNIRADFQVIVSLLLYMAMVQEYKFNPFEETLIPLTINSFFSNLRNMPF